MEYTADLRPTLNAELVADSFRATPGIRILDYGGGNGALQFGSSTDKIVPADFTGDGKADIAVWRPSSGEWFVLRSEDSSFFSFPFGTTGDTPMPTDYDNDGKVDAAGAAVLRSMPSPLLLLTTFCAITLRNATPSMAMPEPLLPLTVFTLSSGPPRPMRPVAWRPSDQGASPRPPAAAGPGAGSRAA